MLFYVLIIILVAAFFFTFVSKKFSLKDMGLYVALPVALFSMFMAMMFSLYPVEKTVIAEKNYPLSILDASSSSNGESFFLGKGTLYSQRVLNYFYEESDAEETWTEFAYAYAEDSRIFEDETETPYVTVRTYTSTVKAIVPFTFNLDNAEYDFHIPEGSITNDYKVSNE